MVRRVPVGCAGSGEWAACVPHRLPWLASTGVFGFRADCRISWNHSEGRFKRRKHGGGARRTVGRHDATIPGKTAMGEEAVAKAQGGRTMV